MAKATRDDYDVYLRGFSARTFDTATDIDLHGNYAFALGAFHAQEKVAPHCRKYVLALVAAAKDSPVGVSVPKAGRKAA